MEKRNGGTTGFGHEDTKNQSPTAQVVGSGTAGSDAVGTDEKLHSRVIGQEAAEQCRCADLRARGVARKDR